MRSRKAAKGLLLLLGCAMLVDGQRPPVDDDDFEFEGSGHPAPTRTTESAAIAPAIWGPSARGSGHHLEWYPAATGSSSGTLLESSGSGLGSDDEDDESYSFDDVDDEYDYAYYDEYRDDYEEQGKKSNVSGGSRQSVVDDVHLNVVDDFYQQKPPSPPTTAPTTAPTTQPSAAPTSEPPVERTDHRGVLGAPRQPQPVPQQPDAAAAEHDVADVGDQRTNDISLEEDGEDGNTVPDSTVGGRPGRIDGLGTKPVNRNTSFFAQPGILAAVVGGAVVGLLCAILLVMLIVYRMRKKDEGSYPLDEPKRSLTGNTYSKNYNKEFYA